MYFIQDLLISTIRICTNHCFNNYMKIIFVAAPIGACNYKYKAFSYVGDLRSILHPSAELYVGDPPLCIRGCPLYVGGSPLCIGDVPLYGGDAPVRKRSAPVRSALCRSAPQSAFCASHRAKCQRVPKYCQ